MLGHADLKQTSTYLNATVQGLEASMRTLDAQRGDDLPSLANPPAGAPWPSGKSLAPPAANSRVN